jgi:hypothetical protein
MYTINTAGRPKMRGCSYLYREEINIYRLLSFENPPGLIGVPRNGEDYSFMLPEKSRARGMMLLSVVYDQPQSCNDPFIIFDNRGRVLYSWPIGYTPSYLEVNKVAEGL